MQPRVYTQTFGVVAAIIEKNGKILLVQENKGRDKGKWSQPAGWIEVGEDPLSAVRREVKEETGYDFEPTGILGIFSIVRGRLRDQGFPGTPHGLTVAFLGNIGSRSQQLHEDVAQTAWFAPEEIYAMGQQTLRDVDIKDQVRRYFSRRQYPLELLQHTVEN